MDVTLQIAEAKQTAKKTGLRYVSGSKPGISRKKAGARFKYFYADGVEVADDETLARIKKLAIPPAWQNVWICPHPNGHLQATGYDVKGRKQYKYHAEWSRVRNNNKFGKMLEFANVLPKLRKRIEKDLQKPGISKEKVLATVLRLMEKGHMRIGNEEYLKENGSFGLTTLRDRHVQINGSSLRFCFKGKKGVEHEIELNDKRLAGIVKKCKDIPGYELFQYYDEEGKRQSIDSGEVNEYLRQITGENFSAKDFRTWAGTLHAFKAMWKIPAGLSETERKKQLVDIIKMVSQKLGNTPNICKKYYVHPTLADKWLKAELDEFFKNCKTTQQPHRETEECMLINFLELHCGK